MMLTHITEQILAEIHRRCKGVYPGKNLSYEEWRRCILASEKPMVDKMPEVSTKNFMHPTAGRYCIGDIFIYTGNDCFKYAGQAIPQPENQSLWQKVTRLMLGIFNIKHYGR